MLFRLTGGGGGGVVVNARLREGNTSIFLNCEPETFSTLQYCCKTKTSKCFKYKLKRCSGSKT